MAQARHVVRDRADELVPDFYFDAVSVGRQREFFRAAAMWLGARLYIAENGSDFGAGRAAFDRAG